MGKGTERPIYEPSMGENQGENIWGINTYGTPIRQTTKTMDEQRNLGISPQEAPTIQALARYKECPGLCELLESQKWSKKSMQEGTEEHGNEIGARGKNKS